MINIITKWRNLSIQSKSSLVYTIANLFNKGIVFISIPIFTRMMSSTEVGIGTTYASWQAMLYAIATLSISSGSLNIAMIEFSNERSRYQSSVLTISTLSSLVIAITYFLFAERFNQIFSLSTPLVIVMLGSFFFMPAMDIWLARQRYEYNYKASALVTIASSGFSVIIAIVGVIWAKNHGINELGSIRVITQNISVFLFCFVLYILIFLKGFCFYNKKYWKFALTMSIPLIFHTVSKQVMDVSDRTMIATLCSQSEAGIYGTIYSISTMALVIWSAINNSIIPFLFEKIKLKEYNQINKLVTPVLVLFALCAVVLTVLAPDIIRITLPKEYLEAIYIIPAIASGIYLTTLYNLFSNVLLYYKKTQFIMSATLITAIINIILNYILIPIFGYKVAAYTTLISYIILAIMQYIMMRFVSKDNIFEIKNIIIISTITISLCLSCIILYLNDIIRYIVLVIVIIFIFIYRNLILDVIRNIKK